MQRNVERGPNQLQMGDTLKGSYTVRGMVSQLYQQLHSGKEIQSYIGLFRLRPSGRDTASGGSDSCSSENINIDKAYGRTVDAVDADMP